jgi:aspartate-semialdehyde dehydrogenase
VSPGRKELGVDKYKIGVLGATGMVGQRFISLLDAHPWFEVVSVAASPRSKGKSYGDAVADRWTLSKPMPERVASMIVKDVTADMDAIVDEVDFVFCALDMDKAAIRDVEDAYAKRETPVISNNSAHRWTPDVPMLIPEINADHIDVIPAQRRRLGTKSGFVAVKPNCSIQPYVPAFHALADFSPEKATVCTYQAISGAGKTFDTWPEMVDNVIPYISGEEEKSEREPLKIWGSVADGEIVPVDSPIISAQCIRVPVTDGHMAAVSVSFSNKPSIETILDRWASYEWDPRTTDLPSSPKPFLSYCGEDNRPQTALDRDAGDGMAVTLGRLREDTVFDYKFVALSHNTVRGAAGGAILMAELLANEGYLVRK